MGLAAGRHGRLGPGRPVAIVHKAGKPLQDRRRVEPSRECAGHLGGTGIPGDMAFQSLGGEAEAAKCARHAVGGVLADDEDLGSSLAVKDFDRRTVFVAQETPGFVKAR